LMSHPAKGDVCALDGNVVAVTWMHARELAPTAPGACLRLAHARLRAIAQGPALLQRCGSIGVLPQKTLAPHPGTSPGRNGFVQLNDIGIAGHANKKCRMSTFAALRYLQSSCRTVPAATAETGLTWALTSSAAHAVGSGVKV
jgi:hypothetical protein